MRNLKLTLDSPAENLALDEALLDAAEAGEIEAGILRLWEAPSHVVVLGRSSQTEVEVNLAACREDGVAVLRRPSGGGTIVAGPGCLMFALVLSIDDQPSLQAIDQAHAFVLDRLAQTLSTDSEIVQAAGTSDLAVRRGESHTWQKFSGNAIRMKRHHILYHGTLLYDFDLQRLPRWLATPTRTPDYRQGREHAEFVTNLQITQQALAEKLVDGWQADEELAAWPRQRTAEIVKTKYSGDSQWTLFLPGS